MYRITNSLVRLAAFGATLVGLVLVAAAQASAKHPTPPANPGGQGPDDVCAVPIAAAAPPIPEETGGALPWVVFLAAVVLAFAVGAALVYLAQRRLAHRHANSAAAA